MGTQTSYTSTGSSIKHDCKLVTEKGLLMSEPQASEKWVQSVRKFMRLFLIPLHSSWERELERKRKFQIPTHIHSTSLHSWAKNQKKELLISGFDMQTCKESHNQIRPMASGCTIIQEIRFLGSHYDRLISSFITPHLFPETLVTALFGSWGTAEHSYLATCTWGGMKYIQLHKRREGCWSQMCHQYTFWHGNEEGSEALMVASST